MFLTNQFIQNALAVTAEMVQKGYVISVKNGLTVNTPVFTKEQYASLKEILSDASEKIAKEAESLMDIVAKILKNHVPVHLKKLSQPKILISPHRGRYPPNYLCVAKYPIDQ